MILNYFLLIDRYMYLRDIHQRFMYTNAPQTYQHVGDGKNKSHLPPKDAVFATKKQDEGTPIPSKSKRLEPKREGSR